MVHINAGARFTPALLKTILWLELYDIPDLERTFAGDLTDYPTTSVTIFIHRITPLRFLGVRV